MGDWLYFIIFAGLFYLMMRYGCGAHMLHGHHKGHADDQNNDAKNIDPVCGMEVDHAVGYGKMHEGHFYRFCSRTCLDKFEDEPGKYL